MFTHGSHEDAPSVSVLPEKRQKKVQPALVNYDTYHLLADFSKGGDAWTAARKYEIRKEIAAEGMRVTRGSAAWADHLRKYGLSEPTSVDGHTTPEVAVDRIFAERYLGAPVTAFVAVQVSQAAITAVPVVEAVAAAEASLMRANSAAKRIWRRAEKVKEYESAGGAWNLPDNVSLPAKDLNILCEPGVTECWKKAGYPDYTKFIDTNVAANLAKANALARKIVKSLRTSDIYDLYPGRIDITSDLMASPLYQALDDSFLGLLTKVSCRHLLMAQVEVEK